MRHTAACGSDAGEVEAADALVLCRHGALTLEHVDGHFRLVVFGRRERLAALAGNGRVGFDELGHHTAHRLDTHRKGRHVEQHNVAHAALLVEDCALDRGTHGHHFVGVHTLRGRFAEEVFDQLLHSGDTARTTHEDHFVDLAFLHTGVTQCVLAGHKASLDEAVCQLFELGASQRANQVLGHAAHGHDVGEVDLRRSRARKFDLRLFGCFLQALHRHRVGGEVGALVVFEFLYEPVDDHLVEVVTAQVRVAVGREHFEHAAAEFEDRDVERTAAEVKYGDFHVLVRLVHTVSQRGRGGFVDDALHFESGDLTGLFRGLTLRVGEVSRHRDHGFRHFLTEVVFGRLLHFLKNHGRNFLRRVVAAVHGHAGLSALVHYAVGHAAHFLLHLSEALTHEALDRIDRASGVCDGLALGGIAHLAFAAFDEGHHRRRGALAFAVGDDNRFVTFKYGYARVCGSEVNSNNLSHSGMLLFYFCCYINKESCAARWADLCCRAAFGGLRS